MMIFFHELSTQTEVKCHKHNMIMFGTIFLQSILSTLGVISLNFPLKWGELCHAKKQSVM